MGWSFENREKGITNKKWLEGVYSERFEVVDVATKNMVMYVAIREKATGLVSAEVVLTQWVPNDYFNFGTKHMSESMGPNEDDCPERIFRLLSPLDDLYGPDDGTGEGSRGWAGSWRERVEARYAKPKLKNGDIVRFNETWLKVKDFIVEKRGRSTLFRPIVDGIPSYSQWRIRRWRDYDYEVVTPA